LVSNKYKTSSLKITNFIISVFNEHPALLNGWEEAPHQNFQNFKKVLCQWGSSLHHIKTPCGEWQVGGSPVLAFAPVSKQECGGLIKPLTMADSSLPVKVVME